MFIQQLFSEDGRQTYLFVVLTVVISVVLHELAHGWAAIRYGDDTPIRLGRMTGNPLVHMGPVSLLALFLFGIAWGQMPIDPTRLRGRYSEAKVSAAGPAMNLFLALTALTGVGLWWRYGNPQPTPLQDNFLFFLWIFGQINMLLLLFNLLPVPPLDGAHILANFSRGYAQAINDPTKQAIWFLGLIAGFSFASKIFSGWAAQAARWYTALLSG